MEWDWDERYVSWGYSAFLTALNGQARVQLLGFAFSFPFICTLTFRRGRTFRAGAGMESEGSCAGKRPARGERPL